MTQPTQSLLLLGAGGHAASCLDVIELEGRFAIAGLVDAARAAGEVVLGHRILGTDAELPRLRATVANALVGVGQIQSADLRVKLFGQLDALGFGLPAIVSPRAYVSRHARLGRGTIVMHGAVVNAGAVIGDNCIVNSQALVEHGASVGDHCHVSTGAAVNGDARIGSRTFIGSGATVREGIEVGEGCVIGMGEIVFAACTAGTRVTGGRKAAGA